MSDEPTTGCHANAVRILTGMLPMLDSANLYLRWWGQGASLFMIGIVRFFIDFEVGSFAVT